MATEIHVLRCDRSVKTVCISTEWKVRDCVIIISHCHRTEWTAWVRCILS